jgi:hypothetical protein
MNLVPPEYEAGVLRISVAMSGESEGLSSVNTLSV